MATKKRAPTIRAPGVLPKLTETEQDLLWQMEHGYQLETDSLGRDLLKIVWRVVKNAKKSRSKEAAGPRR